MTYSWMCVLIGAATAMAGHDPSPFVAACFVIAAIQERK